jgi:ADP-ribose pyrophosphatase YjhB (NUDIX family)
MIDLYGFQNVVAIKILVRKDDKILLIREPEFNDWKPNHLGLPGGKPLINESLFETINRKINTEIGLQIDIKGIVKLIDIIMPAKTVYHLVLAADYLSGEIDTNRTESKDINWYSLDQIVELRKSDFTEYYNDEIIRLYLENKLPVYPLNIIDEQDNRDEVVAEWMKK